MFQDAIEYHKTQGIAQWNEIYSSVRLDAFTHNPFSCRLYELIGYTKTGEVVFRKGRFNLYEKPLHNTAD